MGSSENVQGEQKTLYGKLTPAKHHVSGIHDALDQLATDDNAAMTQAGRQQGLDLKCAYARQVYVREPKCKAFLHLMSSCVGDEGACALSGLLAIIMQQYGAEHLTNLAPSVLSCWSDGSQVN